MSRSEIQDINMKKNPFSYRLIDETRENTLRSIDITQDLTNFS